MDRLKILLLLGMLAIPAGAHTFFTALPTLCFTNGSATYRVSSSAASPDYSIKIENKAARADLRIAIVDSPETADFVLVDDAGAIESAACNEPSAKTIRVGASESAPDMVVSLAHDMPDADYRLYVYSARFSRDQAAALLAVMSKRAGKRTLAQGAS